MMTVIINRPRLRSALRKLQALPVGDDPVDLAMVHQEILDLLAAAAALKPVCVLGRGFAPPGWADGATAIARGLGMHVLRGPQWRHDDFPREITDALGIRGGEEHEIFYVTRSRARLAELGAVRDAGGRPSVEQEARLLGYPPCCVVDHHRKVEMMGRAFLLMARRAAGGNEDRFRQVFADDAALAPETEEEVALLSAAQRHNPLPFTSVAMCDDCEGAEDSPARRMAGAYRKLATDLDRGFALRVAQAGEILTGP